MSGQGDSDVSQCISNGRNPVGGIRRNRRHSAYQIQQLESYYLVSPFPTASQRMELGRRLNMEPKQVKSWFQKKRCKENDKLRAALRRAMTDLDSEMQRLRFENAMLKREIDQMSNFISYHFHLPGNTSGQF